MAKRILWSTLLALVASVSALAQEFPRYEVFTGYGYVRPSGGQANLNGWHLSFTANMTEWVGAAVELSGQYGTQTLNATKTNTHFNSIGFGPRFAYRRNERVVPFAHVLFGLARGKWDGPTPVSGEETSFGTAMGGGLDARLSNHFSIRIVQADYVRTHFGETPEHLFRLSTGALISF